MAKRVETDISFMQSAIRLARRGEGRVEPNPMVGCVIIKSGRVIGEGYHHKFGGPHAEIEALRACNTSPRGATAYVTLEPCNIHGKTPPCTDALIAAGVKRVVTAMVDPNPKVSGRGIKKLKDAGIDVTVGVCEKEATEINRPFTKLMTERQPWVILKWAQSIDGKIATRTNDSKWITDEHARAHAHRVRGRVDAIIVGANTAKVDNPSLTCRVGNPKRVATRIVLDAQLKTPMSATLVTTARDVPTWFFCAKNAPKAKQKSLEVANCRVIPVVEKQEALSLKAVLKELGKRDMTNVIVEGGGTLLGHFVDGRLADEFHIYVAPILIGGRDAVGSLNAKGVAKVPQALRLANPTQKKLGNGWLIACRV